MDDADAAACARAWEQVAALHGRVLRAQGASEPAIAYALARLKPLHAALQRPVEVTAPVPIEAKPAIDAIAAHGDRQMAALAMAFLDLAVELYEARLSAAAAALPRS